MNGLKKDKKIAGIKPGDHVLVAGLGKSGLAAVRLLQQLKARISVSDSRPAAAIGLEALSALKAAGIGVETGGHSAEMFTSVDLILISPGVPLNIGALQAARLRGIPIIGEMALAPFLMKTPVVAVTGTNGKSTVTKLLGEIFSAAYEKVFVGGNIGTPLAEYLAGPQDCDLAVLEISSFQLDTAAGFRPRAAVLLNITPDHLDRYDSYDGYAASKFSLFAAQQSEDFAIVNRDDEEISKRLRGIEPAAALYTFGNHLAGDQYGAGRDGDRVVLQLPLESGAIQHESYRIENMILLQSPNFENAMAAILTARLMGCPEAAVVSAIAAFKPLDHRVTLVGEVEGVGYYDDSKATNMGAVKAALAGFERPVILIGGGRGKGGDYVFLHEIVRHKVKAMVLIGEASEQMAESFRNVTMVEQAQDLTAAVGLAAKIARAGDIVLLSPACASFDMFTSYAHRGEVFRKAVQSLIKKKAA